MNRVLKGLLYDTSILKNKYQYSSSFTIPFFLFSQ